MISPTEISSSITDSGVLPARSTSLIRSKRSRKAYRPPSRARRRSIAGIVTRTLPPPKEASETVVRLCFWSCGRKEALRPVRATACSEMSACWLCAGSFTISRSLSKACSRMFTTSGLGVISLDRISESAVSVLCASSWILVRPKKALPPLIEWAARKTLFTRVSSLAAPCSSMVSRSASMPARCSRDSARNSFKSSSSLPVPINPS